MEDSGRKNRMIIVVATVLILASISMSLAWYRIRTGEVEYLFYVIGPSSDNRLASEVTAGMYLWVFLGWILLAAVVMELRRTTLVFGWLAMTASIVTIAYFMSEGTGVLSPSDFMGSGYDEFHPSVEQVWGPSIGWYMAVLAAAIQTAVVMLLMYDLFAKKSEPYPGPFEQ